MPCNTARPARACLLAATLLFVTACSGPTSPPAAPPPAAVTIMTFNVLNLFDNADDPDRDDKAYLPIAAKESEAHIAACEEIPVEAWRNECLYLDWNDAVIDHKLATLAATIRQVDEGRGPDIIAFQEVENAAILDRLSFGFLQEANYGPAILIEGQDARGIDVAFLSRLPLTQAPVLHPLDFPDYPDRQKDTRGVLQASFMLPDGSTLTGFAVHFPAPYQPTAMRERAYRHLNELRAALPADHNVFAAGDFNTTSGEDREQSLLGRFVRPGWTVAHDYCDGCPGTHYYARDDVWSFLDMILYSPRRDGGPGWRIRKDAVQLAVGHPQQLNADGSPARYDAVARSGVSDHLPLLLTLDAPE